MTNRASHADWRQAVRSASALTTAAPPVPPPPVGPMEDRKAQLGTYVPEPMLLQLKELSFKLSKDSGRRVTISDIVTVALREFIERHAG